MMVATGKKFPHPTLSFRLNMFSARILQTLEYFDLQDLPLTAPELERFLVSDKEYMRANQNEQHDLNRYAAVHSPVELGQLIRELDRMKADGEIIESRGLYALSGREGIIEARLAGYLYGIKRERIIRRYVRFAGHLPFVRGVALAGSQALGRQKPNSDIDLLVITQPGGMWTARTVVMLFFQLLGVRRYGLRIADRVCLNHYLAGTEERLGERNLYTATEYLKLRPLANHASVYDFQRSNLRWIKMYFPNATVPEWKSGEQSWLQTFLEKALANKFGRWLENRLKDWQQRRIRQDHFVFVRDDELSFHPDSKQRLLLERYFAE